jgi:hypothetical protein
LLGDQKADTRTIGIKIEGELREIIETAKRMAIQT